MAEQSQQLKTNMALLVGRIEEIEVRNGRHYHRVSLPAADEYERPGAATIESSERLGTVGQVITRACRVVGWAKQFKRRDGTPGHEVVTRFLA